MWSDTMYEPFVVLWPINLWKKKQNLSTFATFLESSGNLGFVLSETVEFCRFFSHAWRCYFLRCSYADISFFFFFFPFSQLAQPFLNHSLKSRQYKSLVPVDVDKENGDPAFLPVFKREIRLKPRSSDDGVDVTSLEREVEELFKDSVRSALFSAVLQPNVGATSSKQSNKIKLPPFVSTTVVSPGLGTERLYGEDLDVFRYRTVSGTNTFGYSGAVSGSSPSSSTGSSSQ